MRRIIYAIMALAMLVACQKNEEESNPNIDKLIYGGGWTAYTGETYDVEEFLTVTGNPISLGIKTEKLASSFHFSRNGSGTRYVKYYAPKGLITEYPYDYAAINFKWEISGDRITITNTTKDNIIPDNCTIDIVAFYSDRFTGKYNGITMSFLNDIAWLDEE